MTQNNFWNTCIRKLEYRPSSPCDRSDCEWYIHCKISNNCFWTYVRDNSREDGFMKPLEPTEIGKLLNTPTSKILEYIESAEDTLRLSLSSEDTTDAVVSLRNDIGPVILPEEELEDTDAFDIIIEDNPLF